MPCPICGSPIKNPNTTSHINTKRHQAALKRQSSTISAIADVETAVKPTPALENRITTLEKSFQGLIQKVDFLADEIGLIQKRLAGLSIMPQSPQKEASTLSQAFLSALSSQVRRGGTSSPWVSIEAAYATLPAHLRNWRQLEELIPVLFDQGVIILGEGGGSKKILLRGKRYGLVRKK